MTPYICGASVLGMLVWLLWPVLGTAFVADDIPNSQRSAGLAAANESLLDFTFRLTRQWMKNEGRFFPVSVFENALIFHTVHSRFIYKSLELLFLVVLALSLAALVKLISQSWRTSLLAVVFFSVALQVRVWYDPTISFGLLLPSTGIKAVTALCLVVLGIRSTTTRHSYVYFGTAFILWSLALMQYEIVLLLSSVAVLIAFHETSQSKVKRTIGVLSVATPSLIFLGISRLIRSGVVASPAYATNLELSAISRTIKYQVLGAVPLTVPYSRVDGRFGVWGSISRLSLDQIVLGALFAAVIVYLVCTIEYQPLKTRLFLICSGLCLLVLPAGPTSLSVRWQTEVGPGHAYLPVMLQYLGTALLLLSVAIELRQLAARVFRNESLAKSTAIAVVGTVIAVASIGAISTNRSGIEFTRDSYKGFRIEREIFEAATRRGLIDESLRNGVLLSAAYDPALWVNRDYVSWLGGPSIATFGRPQGLMACRTSADLLCQQDNGGIYLVENSKNDVVAGLFVTLHSWWTTPQSVSDIRTVSSIAQNRDQLLCGFQNAREVNNWWVTECSVNDGTILQKIQAQYTS
jgi:hypothetical protein